ncbi:hypothetical protein, partial [Brevibacillus agri]|uniref:hypothetical protein n=1 Tax=Brevibacillus agri TaxID=51101 RepID=UPI002E1F162C|nr:hypothetical protein [Brevibacillus agri]
ANLPCVGVIFSIAQSQELMPASGSMSSPTYEASFSRLHKNLDRLFINLDIEDEQVLKQVLQRLIHQIEVFEGGKIKIHYNLSQPLPSN